MFKLEIETRNAAFVDDPRNEVARILRVVADKLERGILVPVAYRPLRDVNGNAVGTADLVVDP